MNSVRTRARLAKIHSSGRGGHPVSVRRFAASCFRDGGERRATPRAKEYADAAFKHALFSLAWPFILALFVLFVAVAALGELGILKYAYERMGIPSRYALGILLLSLLGSAINIPVAGLPQEAMVSGRLVDFYGVPYVVPVSTSGREPSLR